MTIFILDSYGSHATVVRRLLELGVYDIFYYSDTRTAPFDELTGLTRVSRLLTLLDFSPRANIATAVLLGRGMSRPPRDAVDLATRRAGIELIHGADLLADVAAGGQRPGALCLVGDSCLTATDLDGCGNRSELLEIPWCRITPLHFKDEPLLPLLAGWGKAVGRYLLATPDNKRTATQIASRDPGVETIDEYEHLAHALAARLPQSPSPRLLVAVTEQSPAVTARLISLLGVRNLRISEMGRLESGPEEGPFAISLDFDGSPN